jgi:uncharacterized protein
MPPAYKALLDRAVQRKGPQGRMLDNLKKQRPASLDETVHRLHHEAFAEIDCLKCGNCCRTTGPRFTPKDIERLARHQRMKPGAIAERYLRIDEDGDHVLQSVPCPFLGSDNYCSVYEARPEACRAYPHTDRHKFHQALGITRHNALICPAVARIVGELEKVY